MNKSLPRIKEFDDRKKKDDIRYRSSQYDYFQNRLPRNIIESNNFL